MKLYIKKLICHWFGHRPPMDWVGETQYGEIHNLPIRNGKSRHGVINADCPRCLEEYDVCFVRQWRDPNQGDYDEVERMAELIGSCGAGGNAANRRAFRRRMVRACSKLFHVVMDRG